MKKFLIDIFFFLSGFILVFSIPLMVYSKRNNITLEDLPALNFSNSYSFNEKILFLKQHPKDATILAIGSSMTLNNLHSKTVIKKLNNNKFVNVGSWGFSIIDDYKFLKTLKKIYKIKTLIICSSIEDFKQEEKKIDYVYSDNYLQNRNTDMWLCLSSNFDIKYYIKNLKFAHKVRNCSDEYEYLKYDSYGAVNFKKERFKIISKRWETNKLETPVHRIHYKYLDSISNYCKENKIELLFFQSPIRQGIYSQLNQSKRDSLKSHIIKVKNILNKNNFTFVDSSEKPWADSLYVDAIHFNENGAKLFTEFCFDKIKYDSKN